MGELREDQQAELTVRAVLAGCCIGLMLAAGNVYLGLKIGLGESGNITAALLGFGIVMPLSRFGHARYSPLENNVTQGAASAVAAMASTTGVLTAFPAMTLLGVDFPMWALIPWGIAIAILGTLFAAAIERRLLVTEALPFPTGVATAELISTIHAVGHKVLGRLSALVAAGFAAMGIVWLRDGVPAVIPSFVALPAEIGGAPASAFTLGIAVSPMLLGVGGLIGLRAGVSLVVGASLAWGGLAPWLVDQRLVAEASYDALSPWLVWPGTGLMVGSAVSSLALDAWALRRRPAGASTPLAPSEDRPIGGANRKLVAVVVAAAVALAIVGSLAFHAHPLVILASLALAIPLASIGARVTGQTDIDPSGIMGQLGQAVVGAAAPSQAISGLAASSIVGGVSSQAANTLWSLQATRKLGGSRRRQVIAQLIGAIVGVVAVVAIYRLLVGAYGLGSEAMPAPGARMAVALTEAVTRGGSAWPPHAATAALVGLAAGVLLTVLRRYRATPSALALGIGFLIPAFYSTTIGVGALIVAAVARTRLKDRLDELVPSIAAGAIAGEALIGLVIAALVAAGLLGG